MAWNGALTLFPLSELFDINYCLIIIALLLLPYKNVSK